MRLLAAREHSQQELKRKLLRHHPVSAVEMALQQLQEQGLQSDERFAEVYVRLRRAKGYGPLRIKSELRERGLDSVLIQNVLSVYDDWKELMLAVAAKKFGSNPCENQKERAKRGRFLSARGFSSCLINDYLFGM